jgi:hypothetical protein
MRTAVVDLKLDLLEVIHAGDHTFELAPKVTAVAFSRVLLDVRPL